MEPRNPDFPASKAQTFYIFRLGGGDVRPQNLTSGEANALIQKLRAEKGMEPNQTKQKQKKAKAKKASTSTSTKGGSSYAKAIKEATEAANKAGDEWMKQHNQPAFVVKDGDRIIGTMLDVCGFAWIEVNDQRTVFAKWAKANGHVSSGFLKINHNYRQRQELGLAEACEGAALKVLRDTYGITKLGFTSRID